MILFGSNRFLFSGSFIIRGLFLAVQIFILPIAVSKRGWLRRNSAGLLAGTTRIFGLNVQHSRWAMPERQPGQIESLEKVPNDRDKTAFAVPPVYYGSRVVCEVSEPGFSRFGRDSAATCGGRSCRSANCDSWLSYKLYHRLIVEFGHR